MDKYVLDTNLFFNMEPGLGIGKKTEEVIVKATKAIKALKKEGKSEFFMPPRVVDELMGFFDDKDQPFLKDFLSTITVKSPHVSSVEFPAAVFYNLISDIRERSYRGLTIAEEELKKAGKGLLNASSTGSKKDFEQTIGAFVKPLRDRYRNATRTGFLDSVADLDLIVLAKEQDAYLVSTDEGVVKWGRVFGIREMESTVFGKKLTAHL